MPSLIGTSPNQVPTNGLLGGMAFQDPAAVKISGGEVTGVTQNGYELVNQGDIGIEPNQIPLNQNLGSLAYQNNDSVKILGGTANFNSLLTSNIFGSTVGLDITGGYDYLPAVIKRYASYGEVLRFGRSGVSETASLGYPADGTLSIITAGSERLRIDSAGNVGVNTTAPGAKFDVFGTVRFSADAYGRVEITPTGGDGGTALIRQYTTAPRNGGDLKIQVDASNQGGNLIFATGGSTERMRLDASGNLGLGVTPSAWDSAVKAAQIGARGSIAYLGVGSGYTFVANNWYYASGDKYLASAAATSYTQYNGNHFWNIAPSGTAGNAISFTQAMTLDASGNLLVNTTNKTTIAAGGVVIGNLNNAIGGANSGGILTMSGVTTISYVGVFSNPNGAVGSITISGSTTAYNTSSDYRLKDNQATLTGSGEFIDSLKPKTWTWKADGTPGVGFIAHEVQAVSPTSVVGEKDATRIEQYEISPAVPAVLDEEGNIVTPAVEAVMGEREVPSYQAMEYGSAEFIANIVAELQSLRKRVAALEGGTA